MNPNYIHTVTVFNCLKAADNEHKRDEWQKTILSRCFYKAQIARTESGRELGMSNTYTVRIPQSARYVPYKDWSKMPEEERAKYFTAHEDDIIVYGASDDEITGEAGKTASDLLRKNKPDAFKITAFSDNSSFMADKHYRLGG